MRKTKNSIYTSLISLLLCISMLMGTTFAWFTDFVSSNGNVIQSGKLDAQMFWSDEFISADADGWNDAENQAVFTHDKWEPGYTDLKYVKIHNGGSLNLKWKLTVEADGPVTDLADVIDVYYVNPATSEIYTLTGLESVGTLTEVMSQKTNSTGSLTSGQSVILAIAFHMQENAGNKYQNKSLCTNGFSLKLLATQETGEFDSFGDDYDSEAEWDEGTKNFSAAAPLSQVPIIYGSLASDITIGGENGISAHIPAKVKVADDATSLSLAIQSVSIDNNLSISEGDLAKSMNVHIEGVASDNTVPMTVNLGAILNPGLDDTEVKLYHNEGGTAVQMTRVASADDFATHNQFTYDPATGEVSIHVATFSVFSAVQTNADLWDGLSDTSWYNDNATEFTLTTAEQFAGFRDLVDGGNTFKGKTVKLGVDIDLNNLSFDPIGYNYESKGGKVFKGIFDGQNHTVYNLYQNCWELDPDKTNYSTYTYSTAGAGLFASIVDSTIKNIAISGAEIVFECVDMGILVGYAQGTCHFENIVITNSKIGNYNRYTGGVVGEVSGGRYGIDTSLGYSHTFKNITVDSTVKVCGLWGSFGCGMGGVIGGKWGDATVYMENVISAPVMDVYNDVVSAYQWYAFRGCGMLIGHTEEPYSDGRTSGNATASFLTCKDVKVYYGDWVNYTYYEFANQDSGTGRSYPWVRAEAGEYCEAFSNIRYGVPTHGGVAVTDENKEQYATQSTPIVFNQLYGADRGMYGTAEHPGVTVYDTNFKTIYVKNNKGWDNLKLHYAYVNGEDRWTTAVDGTTLQLVNGTTDLYIVNIPSYADRFMITADNNNTTRECYSSEVEADRTYTLDFWHDHTPEAEIVGSFVRYRCTTCGDVFKTSDYDADYLYDGTNKDYVFAPNGNSVVTFEEGKYNAIFKPYVETAPETAGQGWATNSNNGKLGSQLQFWIPTNGRDNNVDGFSGFSCANNSAGVISFKMKTSMTDSFTLSVAKERYPENTGNTNDWTGWGTSEIKIFKVGAYSDSGIVLYGGIGAGATLTTISAKDGWSEEFEVDIYIQLKDNNTISLTYYVNGTKCGTFADKTMTINSYDIKALYISGWTYAANTGFIFDDLSIKYTDVGYVYDGSGEEPPYMYYTNKGASEGLDTSNGNYTVTNVYGTSGMQPQFWIPGRQQGEGFKDFSCANNSIGIISFKMKSSMSQDYTLKVAKERYPEKTGNTYDWDGWGTSTLDIFKIGALTDGATSITLKGGIGAGSNLTTIPVTDGWSDTFSVIIYIQLKNDNTITLTYYINGTNCGTFSGNMTINSYDIRALHFTGWTYTENSGFVLDDLSIKYEHNSDHVYDGSSKNFYFAANGATTVTLENNEYNVMFNPTNSDPSVDSTGWATNSNNGKFGSQPMFWIPGNAHGSGFKNFSCANNSLGAISFTINSSMTGDLTLAVSKERNAADFIDWGTSKIDIFKICGISDGASSITLTGGIGANKNLADVNVTNDKTGDIDVIIFIKLKDDNTITLSYYINGEHCGTFSGDMTINSYDIRALYLTGWTYKANTGFVFDDLAIAYADNGHFEYNYGLKAVDGIEGRYESICTCCGTVYGYVDNLYHLTYEDCGAAGSGKVDDSEAIRKTHEIANSIGLPVIANSSRTYYIGKINETITIKTDTDWNGSSFILDDKQIKWTDSARSLEVFTVASDSTVVSIENPETLKNGLKEGQTSLGMTFDKAYMINIENSNEKIFIRSGVNVASQNKQELLLVNADGSLTRDSEGNIKTPIQYDYGTITKITLYPIDDEPITVGNATITTIAPNPMSEDPEINPFWDQNDDFENSNYNGYKRGLSVNRSNTTVYNVEHIVTNEDMTIIYDRDGDGVTGDTKNDFGYDKTYEEKWTDDKSYGVTYNGFFYFANSYNVTMQECVVAGHQAYSFIDTIKNANGTYTSQTSRNETGSYDIKADYCVDITFDNIVQSENNSGLVNIKDKETGKVIDTITVDCNADTVITNRFMYHGVMGSNWCRNMVMDECYLDRFDAHQGLYNATITNSTLGFGILIIGGGTVYVENVCRPAQSGFIHLRTDYNSVFTGDVIIKDCQMSTNVVSIVAGMYTSTHCGLDNYMIKNLSVDGLTFVDPTGLTYVDPDSGLGKGNCSDLSAVTANSVYVYNISGAKEANISTVNPILLPETVRLKNIGAKFITSKNSPDAFSNITITETDQAKYTITYNANSGSVSTGSVQVYAGNSVTLPTPTRNNYTFNGWYTARSGGTKVGNAGEYYTSTADVTLYAHWTYSGCVTGDTLITLADGTQKRIDDLTGDEMLLVWNHSTGMIDTAPVLTIINHNGFYGDEIVLTLNFSDGSYIEIIGEHVFFNYTLGRYVAITPDNVADYVGHEFAKLSDDGFVLERVILDEYSEEVKATDVYEVNTAEHYVCFTNNLLSSAAFNDLFLNCYDYTGDNLMRSEEMYEADVEKYGLYTYEDFAEYTTEEVFYAFDLGKLKIAVEKGYTNWDRIIEITEIVMNSGIEIN